MLNSIYVSAIDTKMGSVYQKTLKRHITQVFDYKITFVKTQHEITKSKGDFLLKNRL